MLIVVGGHSRHVGKTSVVTSVLRQVDAGRWIAVKLSGHNHAMPQTEPAHTRQTARYRQAACGSALLLCAPDGNLGPAARSIQRMIAAGRNVIAESNRLVCHCEPDLVLFVIAPGIHDWKASSAACLRKADAIVLHGEGELPGQAVALGGDAVLRLPRFRFSPGADTPSEFISWLHHRLRRDSGTSHSYTGSSTARLTVGPTL
jgi:hypothetical protein